MRYLNFLIIFFILFLLACHHPFLSKGKNKRPPRFDEAIIKKKLNNYRFKEAIEYLNKRLKENPKDRDLYLYYLGFIYLMGERYDKAEKYFKESIKLDPLNGKAFWGKWAAYLEKNNLSIEAKREVKNEVKRLSSSDNIDLLFGAMIGWNFLKEEEKKKAIRKKILSKIEELSDDDKRWVKSDLIEEMVKERSPTKRLSMINHFLKYFSGKDDASFLMGLSFYAITKLKEDNLYKKWIKLWSDRFPYDPGVNLLCGYILLEKEGDIKEAKRFLMRSIKLFYKGKPTPSFILPRKKGKRKILLGRAFTLLGWSEYLLGNKEGAKSCFKEAKSLIPEDSFFYAYRGRVFEKEKELKKALSYYVCSTSGGRIFPWVLNAIERLFKKVIKKDIAPNSYFAIKKGFPFFKDVSAKAFSTHPRGEKLAVFDINNDGLFDILIDGKRLFINKGNLTFEDMTSKWGLDHVGKMNGGLFADFDGDDLPDLFLFSTLPDVGIKLYINTGKESFVDMSDKFFPKLSPFPVQSAAIGDINGDGFIDLYIGGYERRSVFIGMGTPDLLLINKYGRSFIDATSSSNIRLWQNLCARGITMSDFDMDGDIDIYVANYRLEPNILWVNNGDGRFIDRADYYGVRGREKEGYFGHSIGAIFDDFDNDGKFDLFVCNLAHPRYLAFSDISQLFLNRFPEKFKEESNRWGIHYQETHFEPSYGDIDRDGFDDLFITSVYPKRKSFLYRNREGKSFEDVSWITGTRIENGEGNIFADMDNDGDLDLIVASKDGVHMLENISAKGNWLMVKLKNKKGYDTGIGCKVELHLGNKIYFKEISGAKGCGSQTPPVAFFGLGNKKNNISIIVHCPDKTVIKKFNIPINNTFIIRK